MIQIINGDLLQTDAPYICHQVNCTGFMGDGVAKQIKTQFPRVFFEYRTLCGRYRDDPARLLGDAQVVTPSLMHSTPHICNLFGQVGYNRNSTQTDLPALRKACRKIAGLALPEESIAMPYRIGCELAGGDWGEVLDMLTEVFKRHTLLLYKL